MSAAPNPEERARETVARIYHVPVETVNVHGEAVMFVSSAIREAVAEENEACEQVAAAFGLDRFNNRTGADDATVEGIASAIRSRKRNP